MLRKTILISVTLLYALTANAATFNHSISAVNSKTATTHKIAKKTSSKKHKKSKHKKSKHVKKVNLNSADRKTLAKVKGLGRNKSKAIIKYRDQHGAFKSINDLSKIKYRGINKKFVKKMHKYLVI